MGKKSFNFRLAKKHFASLLTARYLRIGRPFFHSSIQYTLKSDSVTAPNIIQKRKLFFPVQSEYTAQT